MFSRGKFSTTLSLCPVQYTNSELVACIDQEQLTPVVRSLSFPHVCRSPDTISPMLTALNRRVPRTKSVFDRTSSRRYSSVDYDSNGSYDNLPEYHTNGHNAHHDFSTNHSNGIDSRLQPDDAMLVPSNGYHDALASCNGGDDDTDEYACPAS